jgi:uncharacterized protein
MVFVIGYFCSIQVLAAQEMDARKTIEKCWAFYREGISSEEERVNISVKYDDGRTEEKSIIRWTQFDSGRNDKVVVKFSAPPDLAKAGLLIMRSGKEDQLWLKLNSFPNARKISGSNQEQYFFGTDFTLEDSRQLAGERTEDFEYRFVTDQGGASEIEAVPKSGTESAYTKRVICVNSRFAIEKIKYFVGGNQVKTLQNRQVSFDASGRWRVGSIEIDNRVVKRKTVASIKSQVNCDLAKVRFTADFLGSEWK